jgi:hypothetical protein
MLSARPLPLPPLAPRAPPLLSLRAPRIAAPAGRMGSEGPVAVPKLIAFDLDGTMWYPGARAN